MAFYYMCTCKENYTDYCLRLFLGNLDVSKIYNQTIERRGEGNPEPSGRTTSWLVIARVRTLGVIPKL